MLEVICHDLQAESLNTGDPQVVQVSRLWQHNFSIPGNLFKKIKVENLLFISGLKDQLTIQ